MRPTMAVHTSSCGYPSSASSGRLWWRQFGLKRPGLAWALSLESSGSLVGDTNGVTDIFIYNRQLDAVKRVSVGATGQQADGASVIGSMSADGRFVAFSSFATNLVAGDNNGSQDLFLKDRQTGNVLRVVGLGGAQSDATNNNQSLVSADGRTVYSVSNATNLVSGDTNASFDVFRFDTPFLP